MAWKVLYCVTKLGFYIEMRVFLNLMKDILKVETMGWKILFIIIILILFSWKIITALYFEVSQFQNTTPARFYYYNTVYRSIRCVSFARKIFRLKINPHSFLLWHSYSIISLTSFKCHFCNFLRLLRNSDYMEWFFSLPDLKNFLNCFNMIYRAIETGLWNPHNFLR